MLNWQITYWTKSKLISISLLNLFQDATIQINEKLKIKNNLYFDLIFVNNNQIQRINHKFRKINRPTDVISFALNDNKIIQTPLLGEIYLCPKYISQYNKDSNYGFEYECLLTFVHGILHLLGYDHMNKKQEKNMFDLQISISNQVIKGNK